MSIVIHSIDLEGERAILTNKGSQAYDLAGHTISDVSGGNTSHAFKEGTVIHPNGSLIFWTSPGGKHGTSAQENETNLFWRNKNGSPRKQQVLNDSGDGLKLSDANGKVIATCLAYRRVTAAEAKALSDDDLRQRLQAMAAPTSGSHDELFQHLVKLYEGDPFKDVANKPGLQPSKPTANGNDKVARRADGKKKKKKKKKQKSGDPETKKQEQAPEPPKQEEQPDVKVEYVAEKPLFDVSDPTYAQFSALFQAFETQQDDADENKEGTGEAAERGDEELQDTMLEDDAAMNAKKRKRANRPSVAQLKQAVERPDLVEIHDVASADPKLLIHLKSTRNTVPVPRHWCHKRKYLQGKRGIEKPPFDLPEFIKNTGVTEMREALQEREEAQGLKGKMREKVRPKMGKLDIDYQKLHDAFFRFQTKPKMTGHGNLYYEGKEFETQMSDRKPGELSDELRVALGMPTGEDAPPVPPPWLLHMQRFGPPPSYPHLKVPGLNAPIPPGAQFGYHPGGWGKPPVDENGKPLYGDVFGVSNDEKEEEMNRDEVTKSLWGRIESESEESSEEEESEAEEEGAASGEEDEEEEEGLVTPGGLTSAAPSGITSVGLETPGMVELRQRQSIEAAMEQTGEKQLFKVIPQKEVRAGDGMMGTTHIYDVSAISEGPGGSTLQHTEGQEQMTDEAAQDQAKPTKRKATEQKSDLAKKFKF